MLPGAHHLKHHAPPSTPHAGLAAVTVCIYVLHFSPNLHLSWSGVHRFTSLRGGRFSWYQIARYTGSRIATKLGPSVPKELNVSNYI